MRDGSREVKRIPGNMQRHGRKVPSKYLPIDHDERALWTIVEEHVVQAKVPVDESAERRRVPGLPGAVIVIDSEKPLANMAVLSFNRILVGIYKHRPYLLHECLRKRDGLLEPFWSRAPGTRFLQFRQFCQSRSCLFQSGAGKLVTNRSRVNILEEQIKGAVIFIDRGMIAFRYRWGIETWRYFGVEPCFMFIELPLPACFAACRV